MNSNSSLSSQKLNTWPDKKCVILNHHHQYKQRKKRAKYLQKKCITIICIIGISLIAISAAITMTLLIKPTKSSSEPNVSAELRWNSAGITILGTTGINGSAPNQLYLPFGMACDSFGDLYVADYFNNRVQQVSIKTFDVMTVAGQANGMRGSDSYHLYYPTDMAFDSNNNMYVVDRINRRVQFYTRGNLSGTTVAGVPGVYGNATNLLFWTSAIARDSDTGDLYIEDRDNYRVTKYSYGTASVNITVAAGNNGYGFSTSQLWLPSGLILDKYSNSLLISNEITNVVVRWMLGAPNWTSIVAGSPVGASGSSSVLLNTPMGITLDPMGNLYVADAINSRIQFFSAGQSVGRTIAGVTGVIGTNSNLLNNPYWPALDNQLNLYVSDAYNHRIQMFKRY